MNDRNDGPHGVGGWLALLVVGMLVLGPLLGLGRTSVEFAAVEDQYSELARTAEWSSFKTAEWVVLLILCGISIYGGHGLATKRTPDAVSRAKLILWFNYPIGIVVTSMIIPALMLPGGGKAAATAIPSLLASLIAVAIWTAYLNRSKRVKNTYFLRIVQPTPETHVHCPDCRELIPMEARTCEHCGCKLIPQGPLATENPGAISQVKQPKAVEQSEEALWADALSEFVGDNRRPGLWAKAFATADGDEAKAKARYLQLRVAELQAEQQKQKDQSAARLLDQQLMETKAKLEAQGHLVTDTTLEMIRQLRTKVLASSDSGGAYQLAKQLASSFGYVVLRPSPLSNPLHHEIYKEGDWQTCLAKQSSPEEFVKWTIKTLC